MRRIAVALAIAVIAVTSAPATAATPIKIADLKRVMEYSPSVSDGWTVWTANSIAHPRRFRGYVLPTGGSVSTIPAKGNVRTGGIITSGAYAGQIPLRTYYRGDDDVHFYDPMTNTISKPPKGVNTSKDEFAPSVSGDYLAFIRGSFNLFLYQFSTQQFTKLHSSVNRVQVNGDYVAYSFCQSSDTCRSVNRYQISTATTTKMPTPKVGRANYDPAVADDGTMYWVEGATHHCGRNTKIRTWNGTTVSTVWDAPAGDEVGFMNLDILGGNKTLSYSLATCPYRDDRWGAYRIDV